MIRCKQCDVPIEPPRRKWCSDKCKKRHHYLQPENLALARKNHAKLKTAREAAREPIFCKQCGEVVPPPRWKYCSDGCEVRWHSAQPEAKARTRDWAKDHPEQVKAYNKDYRAAHSETLRAYGKEHYAANREKYLARAKAAYVDDPEKAKDQAKKWKAANPEKVKEGDKTYREKNPKKVRAADRKWRDDNPETAKDMRKKWKMANREKARSSSRKSHRKRRSWVKDYEKFEDSEVFERDGGICAYCGAEPQGQERTVDHMHAISLGKLMHTLDLGSPHTLDNCVTACKNCNNRKYTAPPLNFIFRHFA